MKIHAEAYIYFSGSEEKEYVDPLGNGNGKGTTSNRTEKHVVRLERGDYG
jgi:hypothetical protein